MGEISTQFAFFSEKLTDKSCEQTPVAPNINSDNRGHTIDDVDGNGNDGEVFYGNDGNGNSYLCLGMLANKLVSKEEIESEGGRSVKHPFLLSGDFFISVFSW